MLIREGYELIDCKLDNKKAIFAVGGGNNVAPLGARGENIFCLYVNISKKILMKLKLYISLGKAMMTYEYQNMFKTILLILKL